MVARETQQAWGLVGFAGIVIILLLLDFGGDSSFNVVEPSTGSVSWPPFDPATFEITSVPAGGFPFYLDLPPLPGPNSYQILAGSPCACSGCGGSRTINGLDLSQQIASLNSSLENQTINTVTQYFAGLPEDDLFATNNSQVGQFNANVGLPAPIWGI